MNKGQFSKPTRKAAAKSKKQGQQQDKVRLAPVAQSRVMRASPARPTYLSDGRVRYTHREYIGKISGSVAYAVTSYNINPGLSASFPWLSAIANRYESYELESFRPIAETANSTTTTGDVGLVMDFDSIDSAPATMVQALNNSRAASGAPWERFGYECARSDLHKMKQFFTRDSAVPSGADQKTYDIAQLHVCTEGQASGSQIMRLFFEYTVVLSTPQMPPTSPVVALGAYIYGGTSMTAANPLGTAPVTDAQSSGVSIDAGSDLTFAAVGSYLLYFRAGGTTISAPVCTVGTGTPVVTTFDTLSSGGIITSGVFEVVTSVANSTVSLSVTAAAVSDSYILCTSSPVGMLSAVFARRKARELRDPAPGYCLL